MKKHISNQIRNYLSSLIIIIWITLLRFSGWNTFFIQTAMGLCLCFLFLTYLVYKKTDWLIALSFGYFTLSQIPRFCDPSFFWPEYDATAEVSFQAITAFGVVYFTAVTLMLVLMRKPHREFLKNLLIYFSLTNAFIILLRFIRHKDPWFLLNNPALDAAFTACMIPLVYEKKKYLAIPLIIICLISHSSSGIAGLGIVIGSYLLSHFKFSKKALGAGALSAGVMSLLGYILQGRILVDSSGRYHVWAITFDFWRKSLNHIVGAGTGSFAIYGPSLQVIEAIQKGNDYVPGFFWGHNDWLQILIENGYIGLGLVICVGVRGAWRSRFNPVIFSSLICYFVLAFIQMPMRHILFTVLGAWLILHAGSCSKEHEPGT